MSLPRLSDVKSQHFARLSSHLCTMQRCITHWPCSILSLHSKSFFFFNIWIWAYFVFVFCLCILKVFSIQYMDLGLFCICSRSRIPLPHSSHFPRSEEDYQAEFSIRPNNPFPNFLLLVLLIPLLIVLKIVNPFSNFILIIKYMSILILTLLKVRPKTANTR